MGAESDREKAPEQSEFYTQWRMTVVAVVAIFALLQFIRPAFFLTDDSFSLMFPVMVEQGNRMLAGELPVYSEHLFGGYDLRKDTHFFMLWHPLGLVLCLLAATPWGFLVVEVYCLFNLLLAALGLVFLLKEMEREGLTGNAEVTFFPLWFLGVSYAFSMFSLLAGSSGFWYLSNVAALPWIWWGIIKLPSRVGIIALGLALFHSAAGGYPSCFLYSGLLSVLFLLYREVCLKTFKERAVVFGGFVLASFLAGGVVLFLALPSLMSLKESVRSGAIPLEAAVQNRIPLEVLWPSMSVSSVSFLFGTVELFGKQAHAYAIGSFLAGGMFLAAFFRGKGEWGKWDGFLLALFILVSLLVARPDWLGELILQIPILNSLRWPHKEAFLVVFVAHLWIVRGSELPGFVQRLLAIFGVGMFLIPFGISGAPSFAELKPDRNVYLSGEGHTYWSELKSRLPEGTLIVPVMPSNVLEDIPSYRKVSGIIIGSHNFPALYGVSSWSGYSASLPKELFERVPRSANVYGVYSSDDREALLQVPNLLLIEVLNVEPLTLRAVLSNDGSEVKLPVLN